MTTRPSSQLPTVMRAAVYHGAHDIRFEDVAVPTPAAGELLLEVGTVGVCGTDVSEWAHGPHLHPLTERHPATGHLGPVIPGHEFSGTVVGVGTEVPDGWLGARVASCGSVACGRCPSCLRQESNHCAEYAGVGLHRHGALAAYVVTPLENCLRVDEHELSMDEAALCQPMSIAVHTISRAGAVAGQTVLVQGVGGIGSFLVYALSDAGADVIAADIDEDRLALARSLGAADTVHVTATEDDAQLLRDRVAGRDLRVIFEVTGTGLGVRTSLAVAPRGARIVLVGVQKAPLDIDLATVTLEERSLIGTNALVRETDFPRAVELIARGRGTWHRLAPRVLPLDALVDDALAPMSTGRPPAIKSLIDPTATVSRELKTLVEHSR